MASFTCKSTSKLSFYGFSYYRFFDLQVLFDLFTYEKRIIPDHRQAVSCFRRVLMFYLTFVMLPTGLADLVPRHCTLLAMLYCHWLRVSFASDISILQLDGETSKALSRCSNALFRQTFTRTFTSGFKRWNHASAKFTIVDPPCIGEKRLLFDHLFATILSFFVLAEYRFHIFAKLHLKVTKRS